MLIKFLFLVPAFFATAFRAGQPPATARSNFTGICFKITDGDSIEVIDTEGATFKVHFKHIDCPEPFEPEQPFAREATTFTRNFCLNQTLQFEADGEALDRYGRLLFVVKKGEENLNLALVQAGLAWHYKAYSSDETYARAENEAREAKRGLWADPNPIAPWDWRMEHIPPFPPQSAPRDTAAATGKH